MRKLCKGFIFKADVILEIIMEQQRECRENTGKEARVGQFRNNAKTANMKRVPIGMKKVKVREN